MKDLDPISTRSSSCPSPPSCDPKPYDQKSSSSSLLNAVLITPGFQRLREVLLVLLVLVAYTPPGQAQITTIEVGALKLQAPPYLAVELRRLATAAEEMLPVLEREIGEARAPFVIVLIPTGRLEEPWLSLDRQAPPWAAGFMIAARRVGAVRLALTQTYPHDDSTSVLAHEIAHLLIHDATHTGETTAPDLPRWLSEGIATLSGDRWGFRDSRTLSLAVLTGGLPSLDQLDRDFAGSAGRARRAYAASFDFLRWSKRRYGPDFPARLLDRLGSGDSLEDAWLTASGTSLESSERRWRRVALLWHRWIPALASSGSLWLMITGLALIAAMRRRQKTLRIRKRWALEESLASVGDTGDSTEATPSEESELIN